MGEGRPLWKGGCYLHDVMCMLCTLCCSDRLSSAPGGARTHKLRAHLALAAAQHMRVAEGVGASAIVAQQVMRGCRGAVCKPGVGE
jgi:hypothetical protein